MKTEGIELHQAEFPSDILEGVLHAMLGHWGLFRVGWLHRDVSSRNVLLTKTPVCMNFAHFADVLPADQQMDDTACKGFIIDSDRALNWQNPPDTAPSRSGTKMFMSRHILKAWIQAAANKNEWPTMFYQTAIDDLESFLWVLYVSITRQAARQKTQTHEETRILNAIVVDDVALIAAEKSSVLIDFFLLKLSGDVSPASLALTPLFNNWVKVLLIDHDQIPVPGVDGDTEKYVHFCRGKYQELLRTGFEHLDLLRKQGL